jgi:light-regulated signal transduction histidine kinase (bacteriophytochrome)
VPVSLTISPIIDHHARVVGASAIARDISERRRAEQALEDSRRALKERAVALQRSNEELAQFAYVASHDLSEPLRTIANFTQLLQRRYKGKLDDDADTYISFVVDGATRMQLLIDDLLSYSRSGHQDLQLGPVDCTKLVEELLQALSPLIAESGAQIQVGPLPTVLGDKAKLAQVFQNLLANAIKFHGPQPPRVQVTAAKDAGAWQLSIADAGIGIEPRHAERVFKMFQRLHLRHEYPGTGIGLAVCKRIVERHGGRIWFEPGAPCGTVFHFTIPDRPKPDDEG